MSLGSGGLGDTIITSKRIGWSLVIVAAILVGIAAQTGYISV